MFTTIRPAFKQATRSARSFSTRGPSSNAQSTYMRNTLLGGSALVAVTYALGQRQTVRMDSNTSSTPTTLRGEAPRDSVLNGHSLKEPIHRRDGGEKEAAGAPSIVQKKSVEAESEKGPEGAFNEETGEINWDCPCLGGMADGPCGEQFKAAFSCFVYSEAEPKGMDCVEKFKGMQDCFREHPEIYGEEIDDDESEPAVVPEGKNPERPVPKAPNANPPENSPVLGVTPGEFPSKGATKIKPTYH